MTGKNITILFVEDDGDVRENASRILKRRSKELFIAKDGADGLEVFNKEKSIDVIITDIQMPVMNGLEMAKQIRETNKKVPIIITTAFTESEYLIQAIKLGVTHYIQKPLQVDDLDAILTELTDNIMQRKLVNEKQVIIEDMLKWAPYYSLLINEDATEEIKGQLLKMLDYEDAAHFEANSPQELSICKSSALRDKTEQNIYSWDEFVDLVVSHADQSSSICINRFNGQNNDKFHIKVKRYPYSRSMLFGFTSTNPTKSRPITEDVIEERCSSCDHYDNYRGWLAKSDSK